MKKLIFTIGVVIFIYTTTFCQTKNFIDLPYIEVVGSADSSITPNQIFIVIIIRENDSKDKISVEEQENKMILTLKSLNINTEEDLEASDMLSNYRFYFLKQKDVLKTKEYTLKVGDAVTASKVFIKLEDIGISNTSINRVDHTNMEAIKNACRSKAILNAKANAIAMTKPLMQSIGNAIHITENNSNLENQLQGRVAGVSIRGIGEYEKQKYEAPKIEFEKIKVKAIVNVAFILK